MDQIRPALSPSERDLLVPLMGTSICAGFPSPADDYLDDKIDLAHLLMPNRPASFLWRVAGHSMVGVGIHDGDIVVVDRSLAPTDGRVVVAVVDGQPSLKVFRGGAPPTLHFANPDFPAFRVSEEADVAIWGVVGWVLHKPVAP